MEKIIRRIVEGLSPLNFIEGIVLGGSRATGTGAEDSDVDIGVYYNPSEIDYDALNRVARQLDGNHRENLVCRAGEWGNWVNCGGWLTVEGIPVDLILRDTERVKQEIQNCEEGNIAPHYQTGHPHGYLNVMYRGELAVSRLLFERSAVFHQLKIQAQTYPDRMQQAILSFFLFESSFSCILAKNSVCNGDVYYVTGHLFRSVSALNQVLFAANKVYCLNEKKAVARVETLPIRPKNYMQQVNNIFSAVGISLKQAVEGLELLCEQVKSCIGKNEAES